MEFNLVTFADTKYTHTLQRIKNEAHRMNIFKNVFVWCEHDLDLDFIDKHFNFIRNNKRGFGYWIWKPQVILQALRRTARDSVLVYCDAGCSLNPEGIQRLVEYGEKVKNHPSGILTFKLDGHFEYNWTKMDVMHYLNYTKSEEISSNQVCATVIIFHNTEKVEEFVQKWIDTCVRENYRYVDDSPTVIPNTQFYRDNRHDQSIFSILSKQQNCLCMWDETYWAENGHTWEANKHYPIHARRLKF
jgi:hypothetical protein